MSEMWVHGNALVPRLYGPDNLVNVGGICWTDQQGLKEGHAARFIMRDDRVNFFHAAIPVEVGKQLTEVRAEYSSTFPTLQEVWIHGGSEYVTNTNAPVVNTVGNLATLTVPNLMKDVN